MYDKSLQLLFIIVLKTRTGVLFVHIDRHKVSQTLFTEHYRNTDIFFQQIVAISNVKGFNV